MPTTATMWQGTDTNNVNTEQKQSVQLHSYMHKHTRIHTRHSMLHNAPHRRLL